MVRIDSGYKELVRNIGMEEDEFEVEKFYEPFGNNFDEKTIQGLVHDYKEEQNAEKDNIKEEEIEEIESEGTVDEHIVIKMSEAIQHAQQVFQLSRQEGFVEDEMLLRLLPNYQKLELERAKQLTIQKSLNMTYLKFRG